MRGHRRRDERGAAAVEAALITPVLLLIVFGIIEMGFLMRDHIAVTSMVRNGARIASASADAGAADCSVRADPVAPCAPATAPMLAQLAADAMQGSGTALPKNRIQQIWIFNADPDRIPGNADDEPTTCVTRCVAFRWVPAAGGDPDAGRFRYLSGSWNEATITTCATRADRVGVRLITTHPFATGMFRDITVEDTAIMTFEPEPALTCERTVTP